ncbi:MAG TPA: glutamate-cysteine ligase family protein [Nitrososphaera sp.]|nr:glutamate-cysteine ligase family protein [Nitrososphaera sp.]
MTGVRSAADRIAWQASELKAMVRSHSSRTDENFKVGVEIEICLIDANGEPVDAKPTIEQLRKYHDVDYEYGKCQMEYKTEPVSFDRLIRLNSQFEEFIEHLDMIVNKVYQRDVIPVFLGANPSPYVLKDGLITEKPRYMRLARWQKRIHDVEIDGQKIKALHAAAAIQGFHLHLQGKNPNFTAQMFNHILNLIPSAILLGANSRLLAGRVYSIHEPRIYLYDQTEQQNSGFPGIPRYLSGVEDYIDYIVSRKPVIAKDYFELVKERHDDARIRLNTGFYRVETRVMSVQPTPRTMMAIIEFFAGYLHRAIHDQRVLRPLASIREERQAVVRSGFNAHTHFNIVETVRNQLDYARKGLADLGIKPDFLNILEKRLENRTTAGDYVARLWQSKFNGDVQRTLQEVVWYVWQKSKINSPFI